MTWLAKAIRHPLIAALPEIADIDRRLEEITHARQVWSDRRHKMGAEYDAAVRKRNEQAKAALMSGKEPPPPIDEKQFIVEGRMEMFMDAATAAEDEVKAAIRAHAGQIRAQIVELRSEIQAKSLPVLNALFDLVDEANRLQLVLDDVDRATGDGVRMHVNRPRVTVESFLGISTEDPTVAWSGGLERTGR